MAARFMTLCWVTRRSVALVFAGYGGAAKPTYGVGVWASAANWSSAAMIRAL